MPTEIVIQKVRELRDELAQTQPDPRALPQVEALKQAVDTVMLEPTHVPHYKSLSDKLTFAYVGFEIDHPKLAAAMQGVKQSLLAVGL